MSLFRRHESRAVSYQDVWGADADPDLILGSRASWETLIPVFAAVRLLCDAVAQTPLHAYDASGRLDRQPAFFDRPSAIPRESRYQWAYRGVYSALIRGGSFGHVVGLGRGPGGWPQSVDWLNPARCSVMDNDAVLSPRFTFDGTPIPDVLYIPAFPQPGRVLGLSPIEAFALTSEVGWQALRFGRDWFKNNGTPGGVLKNQKLDVIPRDTAKTLKARFKESVTGRDVLVVGKDWDYNAVTIPADESQFLGTIKATANQVAAIYGVPPERIGGEAGSSRSYANLDMDLRYLRQTSVAGWLIQLEQALTMLAPPGQWAAFNMDANVRADTLTRMQSHKIAMELGIETQDEARGVEDKAPLSDEAKTEWANTWRAKQSPRQETTTP